MIKQFVPILANSTAFEKIVGALEHTGGERANLLRVLTYHRVDEPGSFPWLDPGLISASPDAFKAQMEYVAAKYEPVSAQEVMEVLQSGGKKTLPPRAVMVTFDDAYCDFEKHAWPILRDYKIPTILFVPTSFPDHPERLFWWDRLYNAVHTTSMKQLDSPIGILPVSNDGQRAQAYKSLKNHLKTLSHDKTIAVVDQLENELGVSSLTNSVLSWGSLRRLANEGVTLGAHTQNHPIMSRITLHELQNEVEGSFQDLTREIGISPMTFAYPSGMHNNAAVSVVERAGFQLAFTTQRGINELGRTDRLRLQRVNVGQRTTLPVLRAQLLSWFVPVYSLSNKFSSQ